MKNIFTIILLLSAAALFCQEYIVDYVDGIVDIQNGRSWSEVFSGDSIARGATIRLENGAIIELSSGPTKLVLSQAGTYELSNFKPLPSGRNSVGSMVSHKLKSMVISNRTNKSAVMGVRASDAADEISLEWMSSESTELLQSGKEKLDNADIPGALDDFEMALDFAREYSEERETEAARFYIGYTNTLLGKNGPALKALSEVAPDVEQDFYNELIILKGNLLLQSFAYENAISWLEDFNPAKASLETRQTVSLLMGFAYEGRGDEAKALSLFKEVQKMDPKSETGILAADLAGKM